MEGTISQTNPVQRNVQSGVQELHEDIRESYPEGKIRDYNIVDYLGWGEQGTALVLEDPEGKRHVGKVFEGSFNLAKWKKEQKNLARGVEISSALHHPCIPEYHDLIELKEDKQFVVVREYVEGKSLGEMIKEKGHLSLEELLPIIDGTLGCLEYLQDESQHPEVGVVCHRDINPRHIIVGESGKVSLIDLDTLKDADSGATQLTSVGTKKYAHPNALIGDASPAYDIFSLGMSIAEALLGEIPKELDQSRMYGGKVYELPDWIPEETRSILNRMINPNENANAKGIRSLLRSIEDEDLEEITERNIFERKGFPDLFEGENKEYLETIWDLFLDENEVSSRNRKFCSNPYNLFYRYRVSYILKKIVGLGDSEIISFFNSKGLTTKNQRTMFEAARKVQNYVQGSLDTLLFENNPEEVLIEIEKLSQYFSEVKNPAYEDIQSSVFLKSCDLSEKESKVLRDLPLPHDNVYDLRKYLRNYRGKIGRLLAEEPESNSWTRYSFSRNEDVKEYRNTVNQILNTEISSELSADDYQKIDQLMLSLDRRRKIAGFNQEHKYYQKARGHLVDLNNECSRGLGEK